MSNKASGKERFSQPAGFETAHPLGLQNLPRRSPNFLKYFVEVRVVFLQFGAHKEIKIVSVEEGFSSLGKIPFVIG